MFWRRGNYEFNTVEGIVSHVTQMRYNFWGTWFVGVTANAVSSLKAHQIDADDQMSSSFVCWDIPFASAKACKSALLALEGFDFISDDESDFIDHTYPNSFIYMYGVINGRTVQRIDVSGFKPVKALPEPPIIITEVSRDGQETITRIARREHLLFIMHVYAENRGFYASVSPLRCYVLGFVIEIIVNFKEFSATLEREKVNAVAVTRIGDEFDKAACAEVVERIKQKFMANQMKSLKIVHRSITEMQFEFGEGCCTISYDSHTSQEGYIQSYRSESHTRKLIPFFEGAYPEYMVCRDVDKFISILQYFLEKDRKPGKRQNVKWAVVESKS